MPILEDLKEYTERATGLERPDCVIGGFRYGEKKQANRKIVGSLLLGLYDESGLLHHVGFTSAIKSSDRLGLTEKLEKIASRNSFTGKDRRPEPVVPETICRMEGGASGLCR